jgi:hypothetical protein
MQRKILAEMQKADPQNFKALVVTPDPIEWRDVSELELASADDFVFRGVAKHIFSPSCTLSMLQYYRRGCLMFDDCRSYLKSSTADEIHSLIVRRRQRMVDVFAVGHGFNEIPPVFFTFASDIILFRTVDNISRRKDCLKDFELIRQTVERVNLKAQKEPHYFEYIKF